MSSSLVNSLAKVYDRNPLHGQKAAGKKPSATAPEKPQASPAPSASMASNAATLPGVESHIDSLSCQMEQLLSMQQTVLTRLDGLSQDVSGVGRSLASMREEVHQGDQGSEVKTACRELQGAVQETSEKMERQGHRLDGVERLVEGMQQVISFIGEVVKSSRLVELLFKEPYGSRAGRTSRKQKDNKGKDGKDKAKVSLKGLKTQKKKKASDAADALPLTEPELQDQVEKLNRQNAERSQAGAEAEGQGSQEAGGEGRELILDTAAIARTEEAEVVGEEEAEKRKRADGSQDGILTKEVGTERGPKEEAAEGEEKRRTTGPDEDIPSQLCETTPLSQESSEEAGEMGTCSKRRVTEEDLVKDDHKKSRVDGEKEEDAEVPVTEVAESQAVQSDEVKTEEVEESTLKEYIIDSGPPPSAPFDHHIVTPKPHQIATYYTIIRDEILGGGRFGQVHKCVENSSGLTLAAKIIKARSQKEKDVVKNEIQVMNQLDHANLIQLYAAFESRTDIILVMEYVDGGELFDRIIDENYNLTELDTVLFIRQICDGLHYMHKMYILHLDLKPENILCISRTTYKIKIIDFGLARRYKPREKLRVNFGTPEFLAPEVINYEFVSFPTDMWSLGVIAYMLLSGLSPFLGDDDNETLNNILECQWNFEVEEFSEVSDQAKDFITRLLVKSKCWRLSASECLRHPWLSDASLHYRLHEKKNKCQSSTNVLAPES